MQGPIRHRQRIPFFYDKSEQEIKNDIYERYDPTVLRQCALHLCDNVWHGYPLKSVLDFASEHLPQEANDILELGCSVGRWIADLAQKYPKANCWGMDNSYQMLRQASGYWTQGQALSLNLANKGYSSPLLLHGLQLENLRFGLAKADSLPFADESQDIVVHSFLFDRLPNPLAAMQEFHRILKPGGLLCFVTPLNFQTAKHWSTFYPPVKIYHSLSSIFDVLDWREGIHIKEPLDIHGNGIHWNCLGVAARKRN